MNGMPAELKPVSILNATEQVPALIERTSISSSMIRFDLVCLSSLHLIISGELKSLPSDFSSLKDSLIELEIKNGQFKSIPSCLEHFTKMEALSINAKQISLTLFDIRVLACMVGLKRLELNLKDQNISLIGRDAIFNCLSTLD